MSAKKWGSVIAIGLVFLMTTWALAGETTTGVGTKPGKFGLGFQFSWPIWGVSGKYNVTDRISVQGVFGFFGDLKVYGGRFLYKFAVKPNLTPYGYGMVGAFSYKGWDIPKYDPNDPNWWVLEEKTETVFGFGAGAGIEYYFNGLPEIGWNAEIGFGSVNFDMVDYSFSTIMFGAGAHYYF